jgi:SAM-dependent methyltransferase
MIVSANSSEPAAIERMEMFKKECEGCNSVLELGCGLGGLLRELQHSDRKLVGIDIWKPYLDFIRDLYPDMEFILGDIREVDKLVSTKSFDLVVCTDVLEHLELSEGEKLIVMAEDIAIKKVIFFIPVGFLEQDADPWLEMIPDHQPNPHQKHKSAWYPEIMESKGYTVLYWMNYHPPLEGKERGAMFCIKCFEGSEK